MSNRDDGQWLSAIAQNYAWPKTPQTLEARALNVAPRIHEREKNANPLRRTIKAIASLFGAQWQPAFALTAALILGICTGIFTIPQNTSTDIYAPLAQNSLYSDSDLTFATSIIQHHAEDTHE